MNGSISSKCRFGNDLVLNWEKILYNLENINIYMNSYEMDINKKHCFLEYIGWTFGIIFYCFLRFADGFSSLFKLLKIRDKNDFF